MITSFARFAGCSFLLFLARPQYAEAALKVYDVVNYGNQIGTGLPGYGIAQGSLFAVLTSNLSISTFYETSFPLPTTAGILGYTVAITSGGVTTDAILVAIGPHEIDAILPSNTPLGPA